MLDELIRKLGYEKVNVTVLKPMSEQGSYIYAGFLYLGQSYKTQEGKTVKLVKMVNPGTVYETMEDEDGINYYTRRPYDMGRVTGSLIDHPGNLLCFRVQLYPMNDEVK